MERKIDTMDSTTMGARIEQARRAKGLDLPQLARRIAVKSTTLQNWESDRSEPRPDKLTKLAGMLDAPLIWLITGETPEASRPVVSDAGTAAIARKLERAVSMQQELASLLIEVSADVARLRREMAAETDLAA
jgi:transcriptional regulator with XRE-family HTH domain